MSVDETAKFHELIGGLLSSTYVQQILPSKDSSSWVFYGGVISFVVVISFFRFWLRQEKNIRFLFAFAAIIYVGGALGFEIIEIYYIPVNGSFDYRKMTTSDYRILTTLGG